MTENYLFSIGHGNKSIEEFLSELRNFNIRYLIDVRSMPYSKYHPEYNKEALCHLINRTGDIKYGYMGDLIGGLPKDDSLKTPNGKMDYEKMKNAPLFKHGISRLISANTQKLTTCIMCSESNPAECHRSKLIGEALKEKGICMQHICLNHFGKTVLKSQTDVMNEILQNNSQNLFGETTSFTSRKSY